MRVGNDRSRRRDAPAKAERQDACANRDQRTAEEDGTAGVAGERQRRARAGACWSGLRCTDAIAQHLGPTRGRRVADVADMRSVRARLVVGGTEAAGRLIDGPSLGPPAVTPDPPVVGGVGVDVEGAVEGRVVEVGAPGLIPVGR